jgi:hypothetical protein
VFPDAPASGGPPGVTGPNEKIPMNRVVTKPVSPGDEEALDALLGAYFKAELPDPWPALRPPKREEVLPFPGPRASAPSFRLGSRLALAASVGLLFVGAWLLGGNLSAPVIRPLPAVGPGKAEKNHLPHLKPASRDRGEPAPPKVKSSVSLEQGADGTGIKIIVEGPPPSN